MVNKMKLIHSWYERYHWADNLIIFECWFCNKQRRVKENSFEYFELKDGK